MSNVTADHQAIAAFFGTESVTHVGGAALLRAVVKVDEAADSLPTDCKADDVLVREIRYQK